MEKVLWWMINLQESGGSTNSSRCKIGLFATMINGLQPLAIVTEGSISSVEDVLGTSLPE